MRFKDFRTWITFYYLYLYLLYLSWRHCKVSTLLGTLNKSIFSLVRHVKKLNFFLNETVLFRRREKQPIPSAVLNETQWDTQQYLLKTLDLLATRYISNFFSTHFTLFLQQLQDGTLQQPPAMCHFLSEKTNHLGMQNTVALLSYQHFAGKCRRRSRSYPVLSANLTTVTKQSQKATWCTTDTSTW